MINFFEGPQGQALKFLADTLWKEGFKVFLAGGCVRDVLLGRSFKDIDVVTDAPVERVQALFSKTIPVGIQFGILRVIVRGFEFEVARFRQDGAYQDGRHPSSIQFAGPQEDAQRRDFTVNALFYDLKTNQVLDFVGGQKDLKARLLRAVGDPQLRFAEDHLRVLRLLRFACQLNFQLDPQTAEAAAVMVPKLTGVSGERLRVEISKALAANPSRALKGFRDWQLMENLFPQWPLEHSERVLLTKREEIGWLLSLLPLNFIRTVCDKSLEFISSMEWGYRPEYLQRVQDLNRLFCLSKADFRILKEVGSVYSWPALWPQLRKGYRATLAQTGAFELILEAATQLQAWDPVMIDEINHWRSRSPFVPLLDGKDVQAVEPTRRGLVLKESLYLQYEGLLGSRETALQWLRDQKG